MVIEQNTGETELTVPEAISIMKRIPFRISAAGGGVVYAAGLAHKDIVPASEPRHENKS